MATMRGTELANVNTPCIYGPALDFDDLYTVINPPYLYTVQHIVYV
jgi:hypothetical protein